MLIFSNEIPIRNGRSHIDLCTFTTLWHDGATHIRKCRIHYRLCCHILRRRSFTHDAAQQYEIVKQSNVTFVHNPVANMLSLHVTPMRTRLPMPLFSTSNCKYIRNFTMCEHQCSKFHKIWYVLMPTKFILKLNLNKKSFLVSMVFLTHLILIKISSVSHFICITYFVVIMSNPYPDGKFNSNFIIVYATILACIYLVNLPFFCFVVFTKMSS